MPSSPQANSSLLHKRLKQVIEKGLQTIQRFKSAKTILKA
jgi:hypothetical protein